MNDLVTWLRDQLDDDEQTLRSLDSTALNGIESTAGSDVRAYVERGLAEVDAKRRILDWLDRRDDWAAENNLWTWDSDEPRHLLALPYADRPGYRDEWRP